jgi:ferrous iron transport protein B
LGVFVVEAPGVAGGSAALKAVLATELSRPTARSALNAPKLSTDDDAALEDAARDLAPRLEKAWSLPGGKAALARLVASARAAGTLHKLPLPADLAHHAGGPPDPKLAPVVSHLIAARYRRVGEWVEGVITSPQPMAVPRSTRITRDVDRVLLHPVLGLSILVGVFLLLFVALFSWAEPLMGLVEDGISAAQRALGPLVPANLPLLRSLLEDGVLAGVGNVVVFVPQIAILFLFLSVLEDSGYLARAAFLLDRLMAKTGLHGRAFVPLLSGFACAVPAILATRTIENTKDRIVTILATPFISCSARLPVYALMIATVFSTMPPLFGVVPVGAVVMVAMYGLSISAALAAAAILKRTLLKSPTPPLVLELPPYRFPKLGQVARAVGSRVKVFLVEAGTTILAITVVLWALFTFPRDTTLELHTQAARDAVIATTPAGEERDDKLAAVNARGAAEQVKLSIAGTIGHAMEPVFAPLGFDWKLNVGILASFAAREVLVSTLGLVYGLGTETDEESEGLRAALREDKRDDGGPLYTPLTALSLLVFFVLAMQCMSTLAATKRETGGWKWPAFQFASMSAAAYVGALLVFQIGKLLGFS